MPPPLDVLSVADMCVDLVLRGNVRPQFGQVEQLLEDYQIELGGAANIFASQFARLGGRAGVIGSVGTDALGTFVGERLRETGVDTSRVRTRSELKTGLGVALAEPDDRAILTYLGTIDSVEPSDLTDSLLSECAHWHIASYFLLGKLRDHWLSWLRRCRDAGVTTSLDTNWDPDNEWLGVRELLPTVDLFLPNAAEALAISGAADVLEAGRRLSQLGPLVVVKCGRDGAAAFQDGRQVAAVSSPGAPRVVDSIGAGDNFDAGLLRSWQLGGSLGDCLASGCRCGSASLSAPGGIGGQLQGVPGNGP